jgi:hypothetical protein
MLEAGGRRSERERRRLLSTLSASVGAVVVGRVLEGAVTGEELAETMRVEFLAGRALRREPSGRFAQPSFLISAWAAAGLRTFAPEMKYRKTSPRLDHPRAWFAKPSSSASVTPLGRSSWLAISRA